MIPTRYAVEFRNPAHTHRYGRGVEFTDKARALASARATEGSLFVRVVEITRKVVWRREPLPEAPEAPGGGQ